MAEAHDFASLTLKVTHDGISFSYDEELLRAIWKTFFRSYKKKFARLTNDFQASIFPLKSSSLFIFLGIILIGTIFGIDVSFGIASFLSYWFFGFIFGSEKVCFYLASFTAGALLWVLFVLTVRRTIKFCLRYKGHMNEGVHAGKMSLKTKLWFSLLNILGKLGPKLQSYQGLLPHLPVPSLDETLARHLESMKPLMNAEEFMELKDLSEKFKKGIGRRLQRYLVLKSWLSNNYISDWWEEFVYLRQRSPIMINSNYYGFDKINVHPTTNQAARAANVTWAVLYFRRLIERQEVSPYAASQKSQIPFCASQYPRMMNSVRIPGEETDKIVHFDDSRHVAVYCKGCWYKVPIHNGTRVLKPAELQPIYEEIINSNHIPAPGEEKLAIFTAGERTHWAKARKLYFSSGINKKSLHTIESAAFVIILDDEEVDYDPKDPTKITKWAESLLHGKGYDRWFDKSLNFIIYKNGRMGANVEHSYADGATTAHAMSVLLAVDIVKQGYDENGNTIGICECKMSPERLKWELEDNVQKEMQISLKVAQELIDDVEMSLLIWDEYGKGFIKKLKVSPDAFLQAALQLTYFRNQNKFSLTYEASMTRLFIEGRTETVRSCTTESCAFVKAMMDPNCSREECLRLLRITAERHQDLYRNAMSGKGIDRHLFALYVVMKYLEEVSPFFDKIFPPTYLLSTSQTPMTQGEYETRHFDQEKLNNLVTPGGGFGPVADDGYGVSYIIIKENHIGFHISSKKSASNTSSNKFRDDLMKSLREMKALFVDEKKMNGTANGDTQNGMANGNKKIN